MCTQLLDLRDGAASPKDSVDGSGRPLEHMASRKGVVTLQTCAHPNRGHAFPCGDAGGLLLRAGAKLGFDPAQVLAADSDASAASSAAAAVVRKLPARCCCGAHPAKGASGAEDLQRLLDVGAKRVTLHLAEESRPLEVFEGSKDGETCPAPAARPAEPAPGASELPAPATSEREQRLRKQPPRQLRQRAQALWAVLEKKVYIPPLHAPEVPASDKFQLERHGHGRGNTKSTKKRRKREDRVTLCRLILHLEALALEHGIELPTDSSDQKVEEESSDSSGSRG
ncbi:unnamed protein product [Effrenium voratum]|nr:unnamed protein product [Effrenium voratum]